MNSRLVRLDDKLVIALDLEMVPRLAEGGGLALGIDPTRLAGITQILVITPKRLDEILQTVRLPRGDA